MRAQHRFTSLALVIGSLLAGQAAADGGHIGWCTGVGNKHNAACAGTAGVPVVNGAGTPTTTTSSGTQGTPTLPVASVSVPQPVAQPSLAVPTPNAIPTPTPMAVPSQVPQLVAQPSQAMPTPYLVPHQVPRPTPVRQPVKVPTLIAARPSGQQPTGQTPVGTPSSRPAIVTPLPGRQPAHALPVHRASADASRLTCLASGFGWRKSDDGNGNARRVGLAPVLYTPDMLMHDLPANHPRHAECLIVVDRRFED